MALVTRLKAEESLVVNGTTITACGPVKLVLKGAVANIVFPNGKHGPYAVASHESLGDITFSLSQPVNGISVANESM